MDLMGLIITVAVVGFVLWLVIRFIPMPPPLQQVLVAIVVLVLVLWGTASRVAPDPAGKGEIARPLQTALAALRTTTFPGTHNLMGAIK